MNKVILLGNLVEDPEVKSKRERSFTLFTVAVQDGYGDKKTTFFFDCVAGGKTGENIAKYFEKGKPICVEGKLYTRKNDETGYFENKISIYSFSFINGGGDGAKKKKGKKNSSKKRDRDEDDESGDDDDDDSDIPF